MKKKVQVVKMEQLKSKAIAAPQLPLHCLQKADPEETKWSVAYWTRLRLLPPEYQIKSHFKYKNLIFIEQYGIIST